MFYYISVDGSGTCTRRHHSNNTTRQLNSQDPRDINDSSHIKLPLRVLVSTREELVTAVAEFGPCSHTLPLYISTVGRQQRQTRRARLTGKSMYVLCHCKLHDRRFVHRPSFQSISNRFKFTVVSLLDVQKRLATSSPSSSPSGRCPLCGTRWLSVRLFLFSFLNVVH